MIRLIKRFFCKIGWHSFGYEHVETVYDPLHTGYCDRYRCKWCGGIGLKDSQGNLFNVTKENKNE